MYTIDRKVIRLIIICLRVYENSYSNPCLLPLTIQFPPPEFLLSINCCFKVNKKGCCYHASLGRKLIQWLCK